MNWLWDKLSSGSRYPMALVAGFALAASFPKIGIAGLAWVAPALMVAAALGRSGRESFRLGYVAGLTHYLVSLYWLLLIPYRWHGLPLAPAFGWLALSGFLALGPAFWVWLVRRTARPALLRSALHAESLGDAGEAEPGAGAHRLAGMVAHLVPDSWAGRALWGLGAAAAWVALEMTLARLLGGFPWNLLGDSQYQMTPLIQVAAVTGVYGVSFLMVWFSLGVLCAGITVLRQATTRSLWMAELFLPLLACAFVFNYGLRVLRHTPPPARSVAVTLLQPAIPQTLIWDPSKNGERLQELLRLGELALSNHADVVIWPEGAIPEFLRYDEKTALAISGMAQRHHVWMIVGSDDFEPRPGAAKPDDGDYFNASFLINPQGELTGAGYHKRNLVIFGEYIPCLRWLPFLQWFTPIQGSFTPGRKPGLFAMDGLGATASVLICFEDVFPQIDWGKGDGNVDFLVNLTNDGWFGESAEQWQHATTALFRAVESGIPLLRCANNGISCWIDAQGRFRQIFHDDQGSPYGQGFLTAQLPLPATGDKPPRTFYSRHGDWFGWTCFALTAVRLSGLLQAWHRQRRRLRQPEVC